MKRAPVRNQPTFLPLVDGCVRLEDVATELLACWCYRFGWRDTAELASFGYDTAALLATLLRQWAMTPGPIWTARRIGDAVETLGAALDDATGRLRPIAA